MNNLHNLYFLSRADPPVRGVLPIVYRIKKLKSGQGLSLSEQQQQQKKLRGLSPRINYTDRATAACRIS
jgi:hypothetical protein